MDLQTYALVKSKALNDLPGVVDDWLGDHVDPETGYVLDTTLAMDNAAAPAKTVGDALTAQSDRIDGLKGSVSVSVNNELNLHNDKANERVLASLVKGENGLDTIAIGTLTYRDIFITNNLAKNGSFTDGSYSPATINAGSPTIVNTTYNSSPYCLKAFGSSSTQIKWSASITPGHVYLFGCNLKVTRRSSGKCGCAFGDNSASITTTTGNAWKYIYNWASVSSASVNIYAGTMSSANADCYIDDVFAIDMTSIYPSVDFTSPTNKARYSSEIYDLYTNYISILNGNDFPKYRYYTQIKPKFVAAVLDASDDNARFTATRYLLRIAERKLLGLETTEYEKILASFASKASVCVLPEHSSMYQKQGIDVIFSLNGTTSAVPASVTKVVTIITALPYITSIKNKYTIDADDLKTGSGNVFQAGDVVTIEDLMYAMMLPSSNTAATALAHYVGALILDNQSASEADCEAAFVAEMAKTVSSLGCTNSTFVTPSGLKSGDTNSSTICNDLLKIGVEAASWDVLNRIWNNNTYTINVTGTNARTIDITSTVQSSILEDAYMILGGKTGTMETISPQAHALITITEPIYNY